MRRRLEPQIKSNLLIKRKKDRAREITEIKEQEEKSEAFEDASSDVGGGVTLDQEFWSSFFGFKSSGEETLEEISEYAGPEMGNTPANKIKPPLNPFYSRLHLSVYDKIKVDIIVNF